MIASALRNPMPVRRGAGAAALLALALAAPALAEMRVQDVARLQGQRTNRLMGYGLVVGLKGTGDGDKNAPTMAKLLALHRRYATPLLGADELKGNMSVALVAVEAEIPENGARDGQRVDVIVTVVGSAKSLDGGQLLTTPLQFSMFDINDPNTQQVLAIAGGRVELPRKDAPARGIIRDGATLEGDFAYQFVESGRITLILDPAHAGWSWAQMVARNVNHEMTNPAELTGEKAGQPRPLLDDDIAVAIGPAEVQVRIPDYELARPGAYITRVLQTPMFVLPEQAARVIINRTARTWVIVGPAKVSPTLLNIPGFGTLLVGAAQPDPTPAAGAAPNSAAPPGKAASAAPVELEELMKALSKIKATPDAMLDAIENLHASGALHAQLVYRE